MGSGSAIEEMLKTMSQPVEADVFLLQPQSRANALVAQIIVEIGLIGCQSVQVRCRAEIEEGRHGGGHRYGRGEHHCVCPPSICALSQPPLPRTQQQERPEPLCWVSGTILSELIVGVIPPATRPEDPVEQVVLPMRNLASLWRELFPAQPCRLAQLLIERVVIADGGLELVWRDQGWQELAGELMPGTIGAELQEWEQMEETA